MKKLLKNTSEDPKALSDAGRKYFEEGKVRDAIESFKKALDINPQFYEAWFNLGLVYQKINFFKEAIACYQKNIDCYAPNPFALKNLAFCYGLLGETKKALEVVKTLSRQGDNWETYFNLGTTCQVAGEIEEGIENFKKVIKLNPDFALTYGQLHNLFTRICLWDKAAKLVPKINEFNRRAIDTGSMPAEMPFINISREQNPKVNFELIQLKARLIESRAAQYRIRFDFGNPRARGKEAKERKIRIGYLSSDFHDHATVHLIQGVLNAHDHNRFDVIAYSHGVYDDSDYRQKVISAVSLFRDISGLNDREAAIAIYKDNVDILIDLKGHTSGNRLEIMALKPAPVAISWLGFPGTTGLTAIDYLIADKVVVPTQEAKYYSEKIIYLPDTYQPNDNTQVISKKKFRPEDFGLPATRSHRRSVVFSSFNQAYKITEETFDSWMRILKRVPGSVLWLYEKLALASNNLKMQAQKRGIDPKRLIFADHLPKPDHLARLKLSDLALDTFTYNGHTTTSDCLWAGVPVITLKGNHFASRVSASLLSAVGLPELITHTSHKYENLAVDLATHPAKLNAIRYSLNAKRLTLPLFNTKLFTKNLEKSYLAAHQRYLSGRKPKTFTI